MSGSFFPPPWPPGPMSSGEFDQLGGDGYWQGNHVHFTDYWSGFHVSWNEGRLGVYDSHGTFHDINDIRIQFPPR